MEEDVVDGANDKVHDGLFSVRILKSCQHCEKCQLTLVKTRNAIIDHMVALSLIVLAVGLVALTHLRSTQTAGFMIVG